MFRKPKVSDVDKWVTLYWSDKVVVQQADNIPDFRRVLPKAKRPKYFYGESSWADSARYASDYDFNAWEVSHA